MIKKKWQEKLKGIKRILAVAEFNKEKAIDDIEELTYMISTLKAKIKTFK